MSVLMYPPVRIARRIKISEVKVAPGVIVKMTTRPAANDRSAQKQAA